MSSTARFCKVTFHEIHRADLNTLLVDWRHRMGPVRRPNQGWSHALLHDGIPLAAVVTDRLIRQRAAGFDRS